MITTYILIAGLASIAFLVYTGFQYQKLDRSGALNSSVEERLYTRVAILVTIWIAVFVYLLLFAR